MAFNPYNLTAPNYLLLANPYPSLPVVTPQMFGAKGDGTTDDAPAFRSALAAVPNGYVYVPGEQAQTYLLQSRLSLADGTHGKGLIGLGGRPTLQAGSSFGTSNDIVTIGTPTNLALAPILDNIIFKCDTKARRCLTVNYADNLTLRRCFWWGSVQDAVGFEVSGSSWIEKLHIEQCDGQDAGRSFYLWSLAGTGGSFINEVVVIGGRLSGNSKVTTGYPSQRFTSTATSGASTMTNFVFIKPHMDAQYFSGQATTPSPDAMICDSGSLTNATVMNPQLENTGSGSLTVGYTLNVTNTGALNGINGISVSDASGFGGLGLTPQAVNSKWDWYSQGIETLRGPLSTNNLSGRTASVGTGSSVTLFSTPASVAAVYLVTCTGGDTSPVYSAANVIATDGLGTWNSVLTPGNHVQFIGSGTNLTLKNVDLSSNTFVWSAIRLGGLT